jgi:glycosyltransferase involved in cell wall biosynthesis
MDLGVDKQAGLRRGVEQHLGQGPEQRPETGPAGPGNGSGGDVAVVIPARNEALRIAATVQAARAIPGVDLVVVVDDGSTDTTGEIARAARATVVTHPRNRGKAAAMESGADAVAAADAREQRDRPRHLLFLDGDLEDSAGNAAPLAEAVRAGETDMTIAVLPPQRAPGGGRGFVVRLSRNGIRRLTGFEATQPLSGQRCLTREAFEAARPLAHGFGVETALTIDLLQGGYQVREVPVEFHHRVTGTDFRAQRHRAKQYVHVARALARRRLRARRARRG